MNAARRVEPLVIQIARRYEDMIAEGRLRPGEQLPTVQEIAAAEEVSTATAGRAVKYLAAAKLVTTSRAGTFVAGRRLVPGPQQRLALSVMPPAETITMTARDAGQLYVPAPDYVADILGLEPVRGDGLTPVIRREQVHWELASNGHEQQPFMLSVEWFDGAIAQQVPELLSLRPLAAPAAALAMVCEATGERVTSGRCSRECRAILDDGREGPLLRLEPGTAVLAEAYTWASPRRILAYGEYVLIPGRVTVSEYLA